MNAAILAVIVGVLYLAAALHKMRQADDKA
jgi:hypothetical protein